jgi:basic membrane protein A and related proteins
VPEGADAERVLTQMALSGCNIIFTTSFGYMDPTNAVAAKFPDVKFEHATGYKREHPERLDLQRALLRRPRGHRPIAGKMTKSNKIGYIGPSRSPKSSWASTRPSCMPQGEPGCRNVGRLGLYLVRPGERGRRGQGADRTGRDVIMQHTDSTAPLAEAAKTAGRDRVRPGIRHGAYKPSPRVSSIIDNWAPYYIKRVGMLLDGTWAGRQLGRHRPAAKWRSARSPMRSRPT